MIYIIIPVFNRWTFTKACLKSLELQYYKNFKIIVIDHGSTDGTIANILEEFPKVILEIGNESMWWSAATNLGVKKALKLSQSEDDFILTINNDLEVDNNYLSELIKSYNENEPAVIGSISVDIQNQDNIYFAGTLWSSFTAKYKPTVKLNSSLQGVQLNYKSIETDLLPGRGVLFPIKCFKENGLYDEVNFPHYMADEDFALRCKKSGYKLLVATKAVVFSHVEETGIKSENKKSVGYWRNFFTSIKSPNSLKNRWLWARKNTPLPLIYFFLDFSRIIYSQIKTKN